MTVSHGQHRTRRGTNHARGIRAEHDEIHDAAPLDAHHDQVAALFGRDVEDLSICGALAHDGLDRAKLTGRPRNQIA